MKLNNVSMKLFSQRNGFKQIKNSLQIDSVNEMLRTSLWNALTLYYWNKAQILDIKAHQNINKLIVALWVHYFRWPLDSLDDDWSKNYKKIRNYFFGCKWYEVYDFIEFVANTYLDKQTNIGFMNFCNSILEREFSAYRFVNSKIAKIIDEIEISEIENAITLPIESVNIHLKRALELLSDKKSPDCRNSIKESISAVESMCVLITKNKKATLGQALKELGSKIKIHPALKDAFSKLYGYASSKGGYVMRC